jgi:hypothetical protein
MRFFTPELYLRFNSADDEVADRADAEWEDAICRYRARLDEIRRLLPSDARKLSELRMHDAEWVRTKSTAGVLPGLFCPVFLRYRDDETLLIYQLWDAVREIPARADWPFSGEHTYWLYDEVDVASGGHQEFWHRILLSDGRVVEIPFKGVSILTYPLGAAAAG